MEKLTVVELKQQLKDKGLPTSGNKAELIKRLNNQSASTKHDKSYLDLLPGDVKRMVDEYSNYAGTNVIKQIFESRKVKHSINVDADYWTDINYFAKRNIDIKIDKDRTVTIGNLKLTDKQLYNLLIFLIKRFKADVGLVNSILRKEGLKFRIVKYAEENKGMVSNHYEMEYVV